MSRRPTQTHYTLLDAMMACPTEPMPEATRRFQLTRMYGGLHAIETAPSPTTDDWRVCSDAVNLFETLVTRGHVEDASGLLQDAIAALAQAGQRHLKGGAIRLDGPGIAAVRAVLEDYAAVLDVLPARVMVTCHRATEKRIREILAGRGKAHDVSVMAL